VSKYVPDISTKRWVIISPLRVDRPTQRKHKNICPFCPGNEKETPLELMRYGTGHANEKGWTVRVIPNKYPITDIHEVIIHSPSSNKDIEELNVNHVELILKTYRLRYNLHKKSGQVLIFCNHGENAGASLDHPHSQIVVLPNQINLDVVVKEPIQNVIIANKYFDVYCPDFSQWPYEVWIAPRIEKTVFGDILDEHITDLSEIFQSILKKLQRVHKKIAPSHMSFSYNYYIYPKENWYLRIIPRFIHRAGFELGTGLSVNTVDPQQAAEELRKE